MRIIPRIALGTLCQGTRSQPLLGALLAALQYLGLETQVFHSQARFFVGDVAQAASGLSPRHLDTWLMSRERCRRIFQEGAGSADLALVTGTLADAAEPAEQGGSLETLCRWLDVPLLAVVDARALANGCLPQRPPQLAGVFLDRVEAPAQFREIGQSLAARWSVPVLGYLPELPELRASLTASLAAQAPADECLHLLGQSLIMPGGLGSLGDVVAKAPLGGAAAPPAGEQPQSPYGGEISLRVGLAYDEAFQNYFADTLDALEARGAVVRTFSPLRDEAIPEGVDLVVLGGGELKPHAARLAANHCLLQSLRHYIAAGGRVYAEAGGLAYLCEDLQVAPDHRLPMVGALPLLARLRPQAEPALPLELVTSSTCWLARRGTPLRGYGDGQWEFDRRGPVYQIASHPSAPLALVGRHNVIGSRVHLHFAALSGLLENVLAWRSKSLQSADL